MDGVDFRCGGTDAPLYEYACHEGNYSLPNTLAGQRAAEKTATAKP